MNRKIIVLILVFATMMTLFSGCHSPGEDVEIIPDATEEQVPIHVEENVSTPAIEYLQKEIIPEYKTQTDEITTTYYCQTYGGWSGDFYATTFDSIYELEHVEPWLLAYNITDYNSDGIEDLFVITLEKSVDDKIGRLDINRRLYLFDESGIALCRYLDTTDVYENETKKVFAFADDMLIELSSYDYSTHSRGSEVDTITYAVTNDIRWQHTSIAVKTYNPETEKLAVSISYSRSSYPSGHISWDSDYKDCSSEQEAIGKFQTLLSEYGITGVEMPVGSTWANRWNDAFYLTEDAEWSAFAFETSPTVSERCYGIEQIGERYDGKTALSTTSGEMTFHRYEYKPYPSQSSDSEATATTERTETQTETEPIVQKRGQYSLEEAQEKTGLFILYPDSSFDPYNNGYVMTWDDYRSAAHGMDYVPKNLVISIAATETNKRLMSQGQLVLFWPYNDDVRQGFYAVEESGYSLFRRDDDGKLEGLIRTWADAKDRRLTLWNQNKTFYWSNNINYTTINGILKEKYTEFPSTDGRNFASFPANQTYTIGVVEGTTLVEKEYKTDHMYLLHSTEKTDLSLIPTKDGYAIFDFSDVEPGEYIFTTSYWNEERHTRPVVSTYIIVE